MAVSGFGGRYARRSVLKGGALASLGLAGAALIGCGDSDEADGTASPTGGTGNGTSTATTGSSITRGGVAQMAYYYSAREWTNDVDPQGASSTGVESNNIGNHMYRHLVHTAAGSLDIEPEMAESWENPDPLTYTFKIRPGVTFHSGKPLTSEDVAFHLERNRDETLARPYESWLFAVESVETPDESTITYKLSQPFLGFLSVFGGVRTGGIPNKEFTLQHNNNLSTVADGTGPFRLKSQRPDELIELERFDGYWRQGEDGQSLPYLDGIVYLQMQEEAARMAAIRTGQADWAFPMSFNNAEILKGESSVTVHQQPQGYPIGWSLHTQKPPLDDVRVRQALNISVDRMDMINKNVGPGLGEQQLCMSVPWLLQPGYGIEPADMPAHFKSPDLQRARQLLDAAGVGERFELERHDAGTNPPADAEVLREQWAAIGVDLKLVLHPPGSYTPQDAGFPSHFHIAPATGYPDPHFYTYNWYHTTTSLRSTKPQFSDATLDDMMERAAVETDLETRQEMYKDIQLHIDEVVPLIDFYQRLVAEATSSRLQAWTPHPGSTRTDTAATIAWLAD